MKEVKPFLDEPFEKLYGGVLDFKDKVVLDVGADYGSTSWFFLQHGAKKVIAVEGNGENYNKLIQNLEGDERVIPIHMFIAVAEQLSFLLQTYKPDIAHLDCEGCEAYLLGIPLDIFRIPKFYQIEAHDGLLFLHIPVLEKLNASSYKILRNYKWATASFIDAERCEIKSGKQTILL